MTDQRLAVTAFALLFTGLFHSCKSYHRNESHAQVAQSSIEKGEVLARKHCQSCHALPDPSLLDARSWEQGVLPQMGPRLGIFHYDFSSYPSYKNDSFLDPHYYPAQPVLTYDEWQHIIDYFTATSPDSLPGQKRPVAIKNGLPLFEVHLAENSGTAPMASLVKINTAPAQPPLMLYDLFKNQLYGFNRQLAPTDSVPVAGAIVGIEEEQSGLLACNIGQINPNNGSWGQVQRLYKNSADAWQLNSAAMIQHLRRPVQVIAADLNADAKQDYLVCEFGFLMGSLSWYENRGGEDSFTRHVLKPLPGAIKAYVQDYNQDGLPDIWVLLAQGEEGVFLYTNKGSGQFEEKQVLRFPPVQGSTYFELADFNKDGYPDIVYTCGDNADYSEVLKPYHGVYIYLNDGKNHFRQVFFYPVNGCFKVLARDFDGDGDLDLATISFFADYARQPEEGFVYFENLGNFKFQPYSFTESKLGRWLTMDAGDLDGDGKTDLVLGNFSARPSRIPSKTDWKQGPWFIYLKNKGPQKNQ